MQPNNNQIYSLAKLINKAYNINITSDVAISGLCCDSRSVVAGDCFIAMQGEKHDGVLFVQDAINNGAVAVLASAKTASEDVIAQNGQNIPIIKIPLLEHGLALLAAEFYSFPSKDLNMIGITGTNGKSSVAFLLADILTRLDETTAMIGTLGYGSSKNLEPTALTTEPVISLHKKLYEISARGFKGVAMEVSSHGIKQNRIAYVDFDYLVFTNISPDHLDYHASFADYCATKLKLFDRAGVTAAIVNWNDVEGKKICELAQHNGYECVLYGTDDFNGLRAQNLRYVFAQDIYIGVDYFSFTLVSSWGRADVVGGYLGMTNVENVLAVIAYLLVRGVEFEKVIAALKHLPVIPGRMQLYKMPGKPRVIIDYAHTPDSLEQVLSFFKARCKGRLVCLFGCGGNRDRGRRYGMGRIADLYADSIKLTADNPRDEDIASINNDITAKIVDKSKVEFINDRAEAIHKTLSKAAAEDIVVIVGKGHEDYQEQKGKVYHHSDCEVVEAIFKD